MIVLSVRVFHKRTRRQSVFAKVPHFELVNSQSVFCDTQIDFKKRLQELVELNYLFNFTGGLFSRFDYRGNNKQLFLEAEWALN